jgi:hypothetical protein
MAGDGWSGSYVYIHRGLCGISLKQQCLSIGVTYSLIAFISIVGASMMLHSPISYVVLDSISVDGSRENISVSELEDGTQESTMDQIDRLTNEALKEIGANGIELLVEGLTTFLVSVLLILGVRQERTSYIFPWVIVTVLMTAANLVTFIVKISSPQSVTVAKVFSALMYFCIAGYFILSVFSYYQILKIRKKRVITFLDQEFQGGEGSMYHTLDEEGVDEPRFSSYSDVQPARPPLHPWSRPAPTPYTEKAVPMTEEEDYGKENVLFAKL